MAMRSSWEGFLKLSLISVPVRAYNSAVAGRGEVHFHQIHKNCGLRVRHQKVCPEHGEVSKDDIVSGYEFEKNQYVEIEPEEIAALRADNDQAITIDVFTAPEDLNPLYLSGKIFFLVPDGPAGQKPYVLLQQIMKEKNRHAIGKVIMGGHEETVVIRALDKLLTMTVLYYRDQVKSPDEFESEITETKVSPQELKLASTLVDASTAEDFEFSDYKDLYTERVTALIAAKLSGKKVAPARKDKSPGVINLMDALRKSLDQTQAEQAHEERPTVRAKTSRAPTTRRPRPHTTRKKTG